MGKKGIFEGEGEGLSGSLPKTGLMISGSEKKGCLYILWTKSICYTCYKTGLVCWISCFSFLLHAKTTSAIREQNLDSFTDRK